MNILARWRWAVTQTFEGLPLVRRLDQPMRGRVSLWMALSGILFLALGAILGALNRGPMGTVIGATSGGLLGAILGGLCGGALSHVGPMGRGTARVSIELERDAARYAPGDVVAGQVKIVPENTFRTDGCTVFFICRGFYAHDHPAAESGGSVSFERETRQYLLKQEQIVPSGTVRQGLAVTTPFTFSIPPDALPTHHGYACSIRWTVHCVLDAPGEEEGIQARKELFVEASPPAIAQSSEWYRSDTAAPECDLTLMLPRALYAEGEAIEGQVRISPLETFDVQEIRAMLLRIENTPQGQDHTVYIDRWDPASGSFRGERRPGGHGTTYVWIEDETQVSGPERFMVAEQAFLPFRVYLPAQWRPTYATKDGRVTWKVGIVVDRGDYPDVRAFHEIIAHTGIPEISQMLASSASQD